MIFCADQLMCQMHDFGGSLNIPLELIPLLYCIAYTGSVYLTLMITVDRLIAVSMPIRAKSILTSNRTLFSILALGIFSVALNFTRWIESIEWKYPNEGRYWNFHRRPSLYASSEYNTIYHLYVWNVFMYLIPFVLVIVLNIKIWCEVNLIYLLINL